MSRSFNAMTTIIYSSDISQDELYRVCENYPCIVSPLHDKDVNSTTGVLKDPHWHIVFSSNLTKTQKAAFLNACNTRSNMPFQYVMSGTGILNYLTHNTEDSRKKGKYIYSEDELFASDLFDESLLTSVSVDYRLKAYKMITEGHISEFCVFMSNVLASDDTDFIDYVWKNELKFKHIIDSIRNSKIYVLTNPDGYVMLEVSIDDNNT